MGESPAGSGSSLFCAHLRFSGGYLDKGDKSSPPPPDPGNLSRLKPDVKNGVQGDISPWPQPYAKAKHEVRERHQGDIYRRHS